MLARLIQWSAMCRVNRKHDHASTSAMKFVLYPNPTFVKSKHTWLMVIFSAQYFNSIKFVHFQMI